MHGQQNVKKKVLWLVNAPPDLILKNSTLCPQSACTVSILSSEQRLYPYPTLNDRFYKRDGIFANNQLDAEFFFLYLFISILYKFRATMYSSSGESIVSIRPLVYVTLCR